MKQRTHRMNASVLLTFLRYRKSPWANSTMHPFFTKLNCFVRCPSHNAGYVLYNYGSLYSLQFDTRSRFPKVSYPRVCGGGIKSSITN